MPTTLEPVSQLPSPVADNDIQNGRLRRRPEKLRGHTLKAMQSSRLAGKENSDPVEGGSFLMSH